MAYANTLDSRQLMEYFYRDNIPEKHAIQLYRSGIMERPTGRYKVMDAPYIYTYDFAYGRNYTGWTLINVENDRMRGTPAQHMGRNGDVLYYGALYESESPTPKKAKPEPVKKVSKQIRHQFLRKRLLERNNK